MIIGDSNYNKPNNESSLTKEVTSTDQEVTPAKSTYPQCEACKEKIFGAIDTLAQQDLEDLRSIYESWKNAPCTDELSTKLLYNKLEELIEKVKKAKDEEEVNKFINDLMDIINPRRVTGEYFWKRILYKLQEQNDKVSKEIGISIISNIPKRFDRNMTGFRMLVTFFNGYNNGTKNKNECYDEFYKKIQECLESFEKNL